MKPYALLSTKRLLLSVIICATCFTAGAQYQWAPIPQLKLGFSNFPSASSTVKSLYVDPADTSLWILGDFWNANSYYSPGIAVLNKDGTQRIVPQPHTPSNYSGLNIGLAACRYNGKMYVGGEGGLYSWDGIAWTIIDTNSVIWCMYPYQGKLLIGGVMEDSAHSIDVDHVLVEWDGSTRHPFKGIDSIAKSQNVTSIVEYKGDLIVAGNIIPLTATGASSRSDIMRWTGTEWQSLADGLGGSNGLAQVNGMAVMGNDLFVAGLFDEAHGNVGNGIARWDGTNWHRMGGGLNNGVFGITAINDTLYVSCISDEVDGRPAKQFAAWANGKWCPNTVPLNRVNEATFCTVNWNGQIVVGGSFVTIGADSCSRLAILKQIGNCMQETNVGVNETTFVKGLGITVSPNPTYSLATISYITQQAGEMYVSVTDAMGRKVMTQTLSTRRGKNNFSLDMQSYASGIYFLNLTSTQGHEAVRIAKY